MTKLSSASLPCSFAANQSRVAFRRSRVSRKYSRYGSAWKCPKASANSGLHCWMESSQRRFSISRKYSSAAFQRDNHNTSWVTLWVTLGLPSRSPPIQEAKRTGAMFSGRLCPQCSCTMLSNSRMNLGTAFHRVCSMVVKPHLASSTGVGRCWRISSVCQAELISCFKSAKTAWRSRGVSFCWSILNKQSLISSYFWMRVRRLTSVGCAVKTNSIFSSQTCWKSVSAEIWLSLNLINKWSSGFGETPFSSNSLWRRLRTTWYCSAMLAKFKKWVKARVSGKISSSSRLKNSCSSCFSASACPSRAPLDKARICSTWLNKSCPACNLRVSPNKLPSKRTSSRRGASICWIIRCSPCSVFFYSVKTIPRFRYNPSGLSTKVAWILRIWSYSAKWQYLGEKYRTEIWVSWSFVYV